MKPKFKVGDRVKLLPNNIGYSSIRPGSIGTVLENPVRENDFIQIKWDNRTDGQEHPLGMYADYLELIVEEINEQKLRKILGQNDAEETTNEKKS